MKTFELSSFIWKKRKKANSVNLDYLVINEKGKAASKKRDVIDQAPYLV